MLEASESTFRAGWFAADCIGSIVVLYGKKNLKEWIEVDTNPNVSAKDILKAYCAIYIYKRNETIDRLHAPFTANN